MGTNFDSWNCELLETSFTFISHGLVVMLSLLSPLFLQKKKIHNETQLISRPRLSFVLRTELRRILNISSLSQRLRNPTFVHSLILKAPESNQHKLHWGSQNFSSNKSSPLECTLTLANSGCLPSAWPSAQNNQWQLLRDQASAFSLSRNHQHMCRSRRDIWMRPIDLSHSAPDLSNVPVPPCTFSLVTLIRLCCSPWTLALTCLAMAQRYPRGRRDGSAGTQTEWSWPGC